MSYADNSYKTVLVLNTGFPVPALMNAMAHCVLGLMGVRGAGAWNLLAYPSPAFAIDSSISEYPVVMLRAKKSEPLEKLAQRLKALGVSHNVFIDSMIGSSAIGQQQGDFFGDPRPAATAVRCAFGRGGIDSSSDQIVFAVPGQRCLAAFRRGRR